MAAEETGGGAGRAGIKPARESFWNLGNVTALIALCTFFFGIGTVADLTHRLLPTHDAGAARQQYLDKLRQEYLHSADDVCGRTTRTVDGATPGAVTYDWMMSVLTKRRQLAKDWGLLGGGALATVDPTAASDLSRTLADFRAADAFWAAVADDLRSGDVAGYNTNLGLFISAEGSFEDQARRFGFTTCSFVWPSVPPWQ